jgi:hypothetical protein
MLIACHDYPGYSVDARGEVYSHWRRVGRAGGGFRAIVDPSHERRLRQEPDSWGYLRVRLRLVEATPGRSRRVWARTNVLVCAAFHGPRPGESFQVRHLDRVKTNNAEWNLRWGTPLENAADKRRHGTDPRGERNPAAKLDCGKVSEILELLRMGVGRSAIAAVYDVHPSTVAAIDRGETWTGGVQTSPHLESL